MTEAQLTRKELKRIQARWPSAWLWKINERISSGKPDCLFIGARTTYVPVWAEMKRPTRMTQDPVSMVTKLQMRELRRLVSHWHIAFIVGFMPDGTQRVYQVAAAGDPERLTHATLCDALAAFGW